MRKKKFKIKKFILVLRNFNSALLKVTKIFIFYFLYFSYLYIREEALEIISRALESEVLF